MKANLYWVGRVGRGRLAIMPHPRGRNRLEGEIRSLRKDGVDVLVSLLTPDEVRAFGLAREEELCRREGIAFLSHPIPDRSVPAAQAETLAFVRALHALILSGKSVAIHCRVGVGRSGLLAAALLVREGLSADAAFARVSAAREHPVPDTDAQRAWVEAIEPHMRVL